ncbi:Patatin [Halosimplex carlsbadense 2-9-1]|uniref:Patatin n=1 Tax=Halosimplex carlsbadense 2-9-1 TaxID=797114 RepID=M0CCV9_9EURY|nr:patatin-like phospholipase family protein [Halosimplex carlsbadense]ELZ21106.1 Patatin [Halosimplex carlsbadense 2-9-1]
MSDSSAGGTDDGVNASSTADEPTRVAIACQGGGSHTAFTCGVLRELLKEWDDRYELVGISGTSGGAFNALAVWYGLVTEGPERAREIVGSVWDDLAASGPSDRWTNAVVTSLSRMESAGVPLPAVSPYQVPGPETGKQRIREILETHIDFEGIPDLCGRDAPELVVGTVDVNAGVFETFVDEEVTVDAVLASAAVPNLFEAVEINGHLHWDGLFSQNPPVNDLMGLPPDRKPEELWVVQINPQEFEGEPSTTEVIADRRNELSGNISLNQELHFIERVNEWVEDGTLPADKFVRTDVRRIQMGKRFHCSTKVDRDPAFLDELRELGAERAREFLAAR